jgi:hypothetical protein
MSTYIRDDKGFKERLAGIAERQSFNFRERLTEITDSRPHPRHELQMHSLAVAVLETLTPVQAAALSAGFMHSASGLPAVLARDESPLSPVQKSSIVALLMVNDIHSLAAFFSEEMPYVTF